MTHSSVSNIRSYHDP